MEILLALIQIVMIWLLQNFVHATTAYAVVACAKFCSDMKANDEMRVI